MPKHFECVRCGKTFTAMRNLQRHQRTICGLSEKFFNCNECGKVFSRRDILNRHTSLCKGLISCVFCAKKCKNFNFLHKHQEICKENPDKTKITCRGCRKSFNTERNLDRHAAICKNRHGIQFHCTRCLNAYESIEELAQHKKVSSLFFNIITFIMFKSCCYFYGCKLAYATNESLARGRGQTTRAL